MAVACTACIGKIERGLADVKGEADVRVNLSLNRVSVTGQAGAAQVGSAWRNLGFGICSLAFEDRNKARDDVGRALLLRTAFAGCAMMNIMLLPVAV